MAFGINKKLQIGNETEYGTLVPMTENLNYLNESIKLEVEKGSEESLIAGKAISGVDVLAYKVSGSVELNLKPENAGRVLARALGKEPTNPALKADTTGVYEHTLVGVKAGEVLPSFDITVDRGIAIKAYTGLVVESISFKVGAKETVKLTLNVKGKAEVPGTLNNALEIPELSAFRFVGGKVTVDGTNYGKVTSLTWDYNNGLDDGFYTISSGMYAEKPEHSLKTSEISFEAEYDNSSEALRENKYIAGNYASIEFEFESKALIEIGEPYKIKVTMPKVSISEASVNVGGKDRIMISVKGVATENGGVEPTTVVVTDDVATKYF